MSEVPQVRSEKSEAEVSAQINRISQKLSERASGMRDKIRYTNSDQDDVNAREIHFGDQSQFGLDTKPAKLRLDTLEHKSTGRKVTGIAVQPAESDNPGWISKRVAFRSGRKGFEGERAKLEVQDGKGSIGIAQKDTDYAMKDLDTKETIHAAAGILGQVRGELAQRIIEYKQGKSPEPFPSNIDQIIKA